MPCGRAAKRLMKSRSIGSAATRCARWCASSARPASMSATTASSSANSFFLYLKGRLSGLGGSWERPSRADIDRYPEFKRLWTEQHAGKTQVSALGGLPKAIGAVRYLDARAINDECRLFTSVLAENPGVFVEPFMNAPSPGILATAVRNGALRHARELSRRARRRAAGRIRGDRESRSAVADRRARSRA